MSVVIKYDTYLYLEDKEVLVRQSDFVASGGQAVTYKSGKYILKLFKDTRRIEANNLIEKIKILMEIKEPGIVAPIGFIYRDEEQNNPIGYYMDFAEGKSLTSLTSNSGRKKAKFKNRHAILAAEQMRKLMLAAHKNRAIVGDPNENNWIIKLGRVSELKVAAIDVDSWAVHDWKVEVIDPRIKDHHTDGFNQDSDWFSFACVTFKMFTGIYPYDGRLKGYTKKELRQNGYRGSVLTKRMVDNKSVFTRGVKLPPSAISFSRIPKPLRNWYKKVFNEGYRGAPPVIEYQSWFSVFLKSFIRLFVIIDEAPAPAALPAPQAAAVEVEEPTEAPTIPAPQEEVEATEDSDATTDEVTEEGTLMFEELYRDDSNPAAKLLPCGIVVTEKGELFDLKHNRVIGEGYSLHCDAIRVEGGILTIDVQHDEHSIAFISEDTFEYKVVGPDFWINDFTRFEDRLFIFTKYDTIHEIGWDSLQGQLTLSDHDLRTTDGHTWFMGCGVARSSNGKVYVQHFTRDALRTTKIKELKALDIKNALSENRFLTVLGSNGDSQLHRLDFTFSEDYESYAFHKHEIEDLNLVKLPAGPVISLIKDGALRVYNPVSGRTSMVEGQPILTDDIVLCRFDSTVCFIKQGAVHSMQMKR